MYRSSDERLLSPLFRRRGCLAVMVALQSTESSIRAIFSALIFPRQGGLMKRSTERILTTRVGSLPRPPDLLDMIQAKERGGSFDAAAFAARVKSA